MRVVLDTNVIVSALLWGGTPHRLIEAASERSLTLCTSQVLLDELREVLGRPHLASRLIDHRSTVERAVRSYAETVVIVEPSDVPPMVAEDADDDHIIAAALTAGAAMIVSGDRHLLSIGEPGGAGHHHAGRGGGTSRPHAASASWIRCMMASLIRR